MTTIEVALCACGCGAAVGEGKTWIRGHHLKSRESGRRERTSCNTHCSACGLHFAGVNAFDAHLQRIQKSGHGEVPDYDLRHLTPEEAGLEAAARGAACALTTPEQQDVVIWRVPLVEGDDGE